MRRRRQSLQVSTFPFLAVLLCAMGSLILLLLVIDRRAKVVARAKALEAVRRAAAEDEKAADSQAEWDRRRQALHEQLNQENVGVLAKIDSCRDQLDTTARDLQLEQGRGRELLEQIRADQSRLNRQEEEMASRTRAVAQSNQQSDATRSELARLTSDLRKLEQTLADLKALRQRQQQTYSLVPYRGKRGDNRWPLYLECAAGGLVFHPDHLTFAIGETSGPEVRAEVERRLARHLSTGASPTSAKEAEPYVLFLIRPNGIVTYYQALAALNGLKLDFGYEFLEADWVLDFPEDAQSTTKQPWMVEKTEPTDQRNATSRGQLFRTVHGIPPRTGVAGGQYTSDVGPDLVDGPEPGGSTGPPIRKLGAMAAGPSGNKFGQPGSPPLQGDPGIPVRDEENHHPRSQAPLGNDPAPVSKQSLGTRSGGFASAPIGSSFPPVAHASGPAHAGSPLDASGSPLHAPVTPSFLDSGTGGSVQPPAGPAEKGTQEAEAPSFAKPRLPEGHSESGLNLPPLQPGFASAPPRQGSGREGTVQSEGPNSPNGGMTQGLPAEVESSVGPSGVMDPLAQSDRLKKNPSSLPPVRRWVNRDWNIFIECRADGVVLYPGGLAIAAAKLSANGRISERPLPSAVQQLIIRRRTIMGQASANEPFGPPHVHFLVRPDGLRSYYQAYPQLEGLQLQMTRENLDPDEEITRHMGTR
jgi:hypothetical protein